MKKQLRKRMRRYYFGSRRVIKNFIHNTILWFKYRTTQKYHIIRPRTLNPRYYDQDTRMIHACFEMFMDYLEEEIHIYSPVKHTPEIRTKVLAHLDWMECLGEKSPDSDSHMSRLAKEFRTLYLWWLDEFEGADQDEEDAMLLRLVKVRQYLWV